MKAVISRRILWLLLLVVDVCLINNNNNNTSNNSKRNSDSKRKSNLNFFVQCMTLTNWSTLTTNPSSVGAMLSETIIMPTRDPHKEAQMMYDEVLRQHLGSLTTIKEICEPWQKQGCHCSGTVDRVSLSCRSIGMTNVSMNYPETLIKL